MQWFIGINEGCPAWRQYADMAKVAIHTALQHTSLQPNCLYDGGENEFTAWLRRRDVRIIPWRTFLLDDLAQLGLRRSNSDLLRATRGVLLRVELPLLQTQLGLDDRVLYTDCDVIFQAGVVDVLGPNKCRYFAVACESDRNSPDNMNSGVMWMHLPAMRERDDEFRHYLRENIDTLPSWSWDQGAYDRFYRTPDGIPMWDRLPPELNWKPYWGDYSTARVIHFHGPKPFQRPNIDSHYSELKFLTGGAYEELCDRFEELLREADAE